MTQTILCCKHDHFCNLPVKQWLENEEKQHQNASINKTDDKDDQAGDDDDDGGAGYIRRVYSPPLDMRKKRGKQ